MFVKRIMLCYKKNCVEQRQMFCKVHHLISNLITVDADGQFLTISCELVFIFASITYTWFVMAKKERKLPHCGKLRQGKVTIFFF